MTKVSRITRRQWVKKNRFSMQGGMLRPTIITIIQPYSLISGNKSHTAGTVFCLCKSHVCRLITSIIVASVPLEHGSPKWILGKSILNKTSSKPHYHGLILLHSLADMPNPVCTDDTVKQLEILPDLVSTDDAVRHLEIFDFVPTTFFNAEEDEKSIGILEGRRMNKMYETKVNIKSRPFLPLDKF